MLASTGRASEPRDEAVASVEDILRREPDFAAPGEMERRQHDEAWPSGRSVAVTTGLVVLLIALVATATVQIMRVLA
ncbi:hypothetical protein ASF65_07845 [Aureimonas sp. Leaf324]|nr:hypothetical protein ASF65_07845 [Aureimonas sp. Leaf324]